MRSKTPGQLPGGAFHWRWRQTLAAFAVLLFGMPMPAAEAAGQASGPTVPPGTLRLGPLSARPRLTVVPFDIDSNVFHDIVAPKRDVIFAVQPSAELSTHLGHGMLFGTSTFSMTGYHTYSNQGSNNGGQDARFEYPFNRLAVRASFGVASIRERPSLEIDLRVRRTTVARAVVADARLSAKTVIRFEATRTRTRFESAVVNAVNLPTALNGTTSAVNLSMRHAFSTLTTGVLAAEWLRDRFEFLSARNASGLRIMPGVEFSKYALISGNAALGYRRFTPASPQVPTFAGLASRINVASVVGGAVRVAGQLDRDVRFSYSVDRPYYVETAAGLSVAYRVGTRWEVSFLAGEQRLAYRTTVGVPAVAGNGVAAGPDKGFNYGMTIGYHLRPGFQFALDARQSSRKSPGSLRDFSGWQIGSSFLYGY